MIFVGFDTFLGRRGSWTEIVSQSKESWVHFIKCQFCFSAIEGKFLSFFSSLSFLPTLIHARHITSSFSQRHVFWFPEIHSAAHRDRLSDLAANLSEVTSWWHCARFEKRSYTEVWWYLAFVDAGVILSRAHYLKNTQTSDSFIFLPDGNSAAWKTCFWPFN